MEIYPRLAEHYYKDYLWESNPGKYWQRIHGWGSPGAMDFIFDALENGRRIKSLNIVLKALEYYHANKVNFMLEKALKHKDPVIAAKVKEYLEKLNEAGKK